MFQRILAGFALALSLLAPSISTAATFEVGTLLVESRGKGPAVILIPGLAGGPWVWRDTAARLEKTHSVYLVTLPGFDGRAPQENVTLDSLQADLLALIEAKKLRKPVIVGHSLGGALSLGFASKHSSRIAGVISVDGLPVFPGTENVADRTPLAEGMRSQFASQSREQFAAGMQGYMSQIGMLDQSKVQELAELSARSDISATASLASQLMAADLRPTLKSISAPVVVISPFNAPDFARMGVDEAGKTGYYRGLLAGIQKLDVVSVSPARHFVMFDQPEKFAAALDAALASMLESTVK